MIWLGAIRLWTCRAGAAAVEFALVIPLLLAMVCATLETGWIMVQTIMLDRALDLTIRDLRVGLLVNPTQQSMREQVCERALVLANCNQTLALELIPILSEASYPTDAEHCINRGSTVAPVLRFNGGGPSQTMFVRACFVVSPMTPFIGVGLAIPKDETGAMRIIAKSGFINEPTA